jgi:hypothetical protein
VGDCGQTKRRNERTVVFFRAERLEEVGCEVEVIWVNSINITQLKSHWFIIHKPSKDKEGRVGSSSGVDFEHPKNPIHPEDARQP